MSDPIKIKAPRSEKQLLALEKARARANEIRLQKAEGATTTTSEQKRVIAMNNRSTRLKKYKNSDSEDSSTESETEEVEEKPKEIPEEKPKEKPKEIPKEKPKDPMDEPKIFRMMNRHTYILFDED